MAKMNVTYSREVLEDGYFLGVTVLPAPDTDPAGKLEESLVVNTADEDIARFSTLVDLEDLAVGTTLEWFQAASYAKTPPEGTPQMYDTLRLDTIPGSWVQLGAAAPMNFSIEEITGSLYAFRLSGSVMPPCGFTGILSFTILENTEGGEVIRISQITDQIVTIRRYDQNSSGNDPYVRVASAAKLFSSITEATNKYAALRAEAASLIDATDLEEESFTGTITEEYD
jgi:hypothetical protein